MTRRRNVNGVGNVGPIMTSASRNFQTDSAGDRDRDLVIGRRDATLAGSRWEFSKPETATDASTMIEYLALPAWKTPETSVDKWVIQLSEIAGPVVVTRESSTVTWMEVASLRIRGYVVIENGHAAAINFELHATDPDPAIRALETAAEALGWEVHLDDDEPDDDDDQ